MADLNRIQFKRTSTKGRKPDASTMYPGELAINLADQYMFTKNDSGTLINLSCPPVYNRDVVMAGNVKGNNYILSKTANYFEDQTARDLNYFGAFRTNDADGWSNLILNIPHPNGKAHGRGFEFQYGSSSSLVKTYGFDKAGAKRFSFRMYHEGDKPTPSELNVYSKQEVDRMFVKNVKMSTPSSATQGYGYFKIATAMIPQQGKMVFIRIYGGNGYNVNSPSQADLVEIVIRGGNGNPKGVTVAAYRRNSLNQLEVFAINTSGDNYDIYVKYGRYTDNVIVEFGKTVDVNLTVHDVPDFSEEKPAGTTFEGRIITMFNTENKRGSLYFDHNAQVTYDIVSLCNDSGTGKKYLRKFRSGSSNAIWHETVQHDTYRLATGTADSSEVLRITGRTMYTGKAVFDAGSNTIRMQRPTGQSNYLEYWDTRNGAGKRQGWIGFGSIENDNFQWYSDEGKNSFQLDTTGQISLTTGARKYVYTNGQYVAANSNAFRMIYGNYGSFWRNDGTNVYLFSTAENDIYGQWNTYRPFIYNLVSGDVKLGGTDTAYCLHLGVDGSTRIGDNLVFRAGSRQSMDYLEFVHWGASNTGRNNVLSLRDSKGFLAEFERKGDNTIQNTFFGRFKVNGESNVITVNAPTDSDAVYVKGTCNDVDNWYIGKGGAGNGLVFCSYKTNAAVHLTDNGEVLLAPQNTAIVNVNRDRIHINGTQWVANQPHSWANQWLSEAPIFVDFGTGVPNDTYMPIIKARSQIAGGYATKADFGIYRRGAGDNWGWGDAVIRVGSAESGVSSHPNARFMFQANGDFRAPAGLRAGVNLGVGTDPVLGGHSIAIGDNDTGLMWGGDGRINLVANGQHIASWGVFHQEHPGLWSVGAGFWTEVDKAIISHGHLIQANDSYSTYVRDIYIRSDIRVKKDLVKFENASKTLSKINGYKYLQKRGTNEDGSERWEENAGLIAQEVQAILPELVEGDPDSENLLRLNYNGVIGLITAAINEHTEEIALLKEENNSLKEENKILHDRLAAIEVKLFG